MVCSPSRVVGVLFLAVASLPQSASALDTWDPYGPLGAGADLWFVGKVDPTGGPKGEPRGELGGVLRGYLGLGPFNLYGTFELVADPATGIDLVGGGPGIYAAPIDTAVFDLDLGFEFLFLGPDAAVLVPTPWVELNIDFGPKQSVAGIFAKVDLPIRLTPVQDEDPSVRLDLEWTIGAYFSFAKRHQLLLGWRDLATLLPSSEVPPGEVAIGWNAKIIPVLELITEVAVGIPLAEEWPTFTGTIGLELALGGGP